MNPFYWVIVGEGLNMAITATYESCDLRVTPGERGVLPRQKGWNWAVNFERDERFYGHGAKASMSGFASTLEEAKQRAEAFALMHHKKNLTEEQDAPMPNDKPAVWDLVISDMKARDRHGRAHYGTPLQPHNGRDPLIDAYQEALDLCVYLRQAIYEKRGE